MPCFPGLLCVDLFWGYCSHSCPWRGQCGPGLCSEPALVGREPRVPRRAARQPDSCPMPWECLPWVPACHPGTHCKGCHSLRPWREWGEASVYKMVRPASPNPQHTQVNPALSQEPCSELAVGGCHHKGWVGWGLCGSPARLSHTALATCCPVTGHSSRELAPGAPCWPMNGHSRRELAQGCFLHMGCSFPDLELERERKTESPLHRNLTSGFRRN